MHCRPSDVLDVTATHGRMVAYCFDSAVVYWGESFDAAVQEAVAGAKNQQAAAMAQGRVLRRWVDIGAAGYADPART